MSVESGSVIAETISNDGVKRLILTRREGAKLFIRPLGVPSDFDITITVVETGATKARISVEALYEVSVMRGEIEDNEPKPSRLSKAIEILRRLILGDISKLQAARFAQALKLNCFPRVSLKIENADLME